MVKAKILKRKEKRKKRKRGGSRFPAHLLFMTSHDSLFLWFDTGNMLMRQSLAPEVVPSYYPVVLAVLVGAFGSGMCLLVLLRPFFCGILRPLVSGSLLFGVRPWSTGLWTFLGEYLRICRIQRFLAQQWIHVYVSLRRRGSCWWRCTSRCVPLRCADEGKTHHQLLTVP